jgi:putative tryptophan/tyrosine transport system substrate-binding protein
MRSSPIECGGIGVLMAYAESDPTSQSFVAAFVHGLQELGWTDGRNVRIDYRSRQEFML